MLVFMEAATWGTLGEFMRTLIQARGQPCSAEFMLPPLSILVFKPES